MAVHIYQQKNSLQMEEISSKDGRKFCDLQSQEDLEIAGFLVKCVGPVYEITSYPVPGVLLQGSNQNSIQTQKIHEGSEIDTRWPEE